LKVYLFYLFYLFYFILFISFYFIYTEGYLLDKDDVKYLRVEEIDSCLSKLSKPKEIQDLIVKVRNFRTKQRKKTNIFEKNKIKKHKQPKQQ
jgi:hypothetical protein